MVRRLVLRIKRAEHEPRRISRACDLLVPHAVGARRSNDCGDGDGFRAAPLMRRRARPEGARDEQGTEGPGIADGPLLTRRGGKCSLELPSRAWPRQQATAVNARFAGCSASPLTDSNRRPPPCHQGLEREARASAGHRDHESPANRRDQMRTSDRARTLVPGLCSLHVPSAATGPLSGLS